MKWGKWSQEAKQAAKLIKHIRAQGNEEPLALVEEKELMENRVWLAKRDYENQLMQRVIIGTTKYESICQSCEEYAECQKEQKDKRGCDGWWLRFLTKEEEAACMARAGVPEGEEHERPEDRTAIHDQGNIPGQRDQGGDAEKQSHEDGD